MADLTAHPADDPVSLLPGMAHQPHALQDPGSAFFVLETGISQPELLGAYWMAHPWREEVMPALAAVALAAIPDLPVSAPMRELLALGLQQALRGQRNPWAGHYRLLGVEPALRQLRLRSDAPVPDVLDLWAIEAFVHVFHQPQQPAIQVWIDLEQPTRSLGGAHTTYVIGW